ncbi:MAG: hypothetical protein AABY22_00390 [Nanoarchaeota archaeon]
MTDKQTSGLTQKEFRKIANHAAREANRIQKEMVDKYDKQTSGEWEKEYLEFTERLVNADTDEKFLSTKYNAHYLVKAFISKVVAQARHQEKERLKGEIKKLDIKLPKTNRDLYVKRGFANCKALILNLLDKG